MVVVIADGRIAIINAGHEVSTLGQLHLEAGTPSVVGVGAHARRVEENANGIAIKAILHEQIIILGDEKVVAGTDAAETEFDPVIEELLQVSQINEMERLATIDLLNGENIANVFLGQAVPVALRHGYQKRTTLQTDQLVQIEEQAQTDIVSIGNALALATAWIASDITLHRSKSE